MDEGGAQDDAQRWVGVVALSELSVGKPRALRIERHHVAVVRVAEHEVYALDNRCPHEGYPLSEGRVEGCMLTCAFHNYQFDLQNGMCVRGDEDATVYPVRIREGQVELLLLDPNADEELEKRAKTLKEALSNGRLGQAARSVVRLLAAGADPAQVALEIAAFDCMHHERGCGHALAASADAVRIAPRYLGTDAALPLLRAADVALDDSKHRAPRRVPPSQDPGRDPETVGKRLLALLEADDADGADGLVRGALWRRWDRDVMEPWFFDLNAAHFLGHGRGLLYTLKAFELLDATSFEHARRILPGLAYALASMTREDLLPEWEWFRTCFARLEPRLPELWARAGQRPASDDERRKLTGVILDGTRDEAWHAVIGALASGVHIESVIDALSRAAAERVWRFDATLDQNPALGVGWLTVTHPFTYAHALRASAQRYTRPGMLKLVLYGVCVVNQLKSLDMPGESWTILDAKGHVSLLQHERLLQELVRKVRERKHVEAESTVLSYLGVGGSLDALRATVYDIVLRDHYACPGVAAHAVELTLAACDEAMSLPERDRVWPVRALIRMLASPVRERSLEGAVLDAKRLIEEGLAPKPRVL